MNKHETFGNYPTSGLAGAESALLTIWPSLERYQNELVLVGGLAIHYLTKHSSHGLPGAVTMDVDLGISLGADGGLYGTISTTLGGLGFHPDDAQKNRFARQVGGIHIYLDFLTECPGVSTGTQTIDDIRASIVPGIDRALASRRNIKATGTDIYGVNKEIAIPVADIGPLLALKLNAFGGPTGRRHPKDAYDVLLAVTTFIDGPEEAVRLFHTEANQDNPAYGIAVEVLEMDFLETTSDGPVRAAEFLRGTLDDALRIRQDLVTAARALLGM